MVDPDAGLDRVRRDCYALSVVILMLSISVTSIDELHMPFADISFKNPNVLYVFGWLIWVFFHIRLFQLTLPKRKVIREEWSLILLHPHVKKHIIDQKLAANTDITESINPSGGFLHLKYDYEVRMRTNAQRARDRISIFTGPLLARVPGALWAYFITRPLFFDYVFPFILAILALVIGNTYCWDGNLLKLVGFTCQVQLLPPLQTEVLRPL